MTFSRSVLRSSSPTIGGRRQELLEVVEHEQRPPSAEGLHELLERRSAAGLGGMPIVGRDRRDDAASGRVIGASGTK